MLDESLYPVVTEPMMRRLPSRMKSFFSIVPPTRVYRARTQNGHSYSPKKKRLASRFRGSIRGDSLSCRERRPRNGSPTERVLTVLQAIHKDDSEYAIPGRWFLIPYKETRIAYGDFAIADDSPGAMHRDHELRGF